MQLGVNSPMLEKGKGRSGSLYPFIPAYLRVFIDGALVKVLELHRSFSETHSSSELLLPSTA